MLCCGIKLKRRGNSDKSNKPKDAADESGDSAAAVADPFVKEMLEAHNKFRAHHQTPALAYSAELTKGAQKWAEEIAARDRLDHDAECQGNMVGENVAMKYSSAHTNFPGTSFVDSWYSEAGEYKFDDTEDQIECGHFTQVVWKASKEAGFGRAVSKTNKVYVVGRYKPAGNYTGEFTRNVMPPVDGKVLRPDSTPLAAAAKVASTYSPKVEPIIGPDDPADQLIETQTVTKSVGTKKIVSVTETYRMQDGKTYTKTKETTTTGE